MATTSAALQVDASNQVVDASESRHYPYGKERWTNGTLPTDYRFTGQRLDSALGLYHMGARFYDPYLNRWIQPDTITPDPANPQSLNRYSYVNNRPTNYVDPSGHAEACDDSGTGYGCGEGADSSEIWEYFSQYGNYDGAFAEYYVALYLYALAQATPGTSQELKDALAQQAISYYQYAKNSVPQESSGAFLLPSPEEAFGAANLVVEGARDVAGIASISPPGKFAEIWRGFKDKIGLNDLRPGRNDTDGLSFNVTQEGAMTQSGKPSAASLDLEAMLKGGNWQISEPDASGHVYLTRALDVEQGDWYNYYWGGPWTSTRVHHPYTQELYGFVRRNK